MLLVKCLKKKVVYNFIHSSGPGVLPEAHGGVPARPVDRLQRTQPCQHLDEDALKHSSLAPLRAQDPHHQGNRPHQTLLEASSLTPSDPVCVISQLEHALCGPKNYSQRPLFTNTLVSSALNLSVCWVGNS